MFLKSKAMFRFASCFIVLLCVLICCSACNISMTAESEEKKEAERIKKLERTIEDAALQYPAKNEEFFYNVYDSFVTVSKYIGTGGEVTVPNKIENLPVYIIGSEAFCESSVTKVIIQEGIVAIEESCFENCQTLETVQIPDSVHRIGEAAFEDCIALTEITFPKLVSEVSRYVCSGCTELKNVKILALQKNGAIGDGAFRGCTSLENVYITASIAKISSYAFSEIPETAVFHGPTACTAAEFCAENFYEYSVEGEDRESSVDDNTSETVNGSASDESGGSLLGLIIVAVVFFGIIGGLIAFLVIRRRRGY